MLICDLHGLPHSRRILFLRQRDAKQVFGTLFCPEQQNDGCHQLQGEKEQPYTPCQQIRVQPVVVRPLQALSRYKGGLLKLTQLAACSVSLLLLSCLAMLRSWCNADDDDDDDDDDACVTVSSMI
eukprot:scaffold139809_cov58-Attheya_sp.AAC.3